MQDLQPFLQKDINQPSQSALIQKKCANQVQRCPRCDSTNTKFCYYNNYNLKQPRYFCKSCKRYWTKGGSLRNVPLGGRCRKNKTSSTHSSAQKNKEAIEREGFVKHSSVVDNLSIGAVPSASADYNLSTITSATLTSCDGFLNANAPVPPRILAGSSATEYMKFSASAMEMEPVMTFSDVARSCNISPNSALSPMGSSVTSRFTKLPDEEEGLGVRREQELKLPSSGSIAIASRGRSENSSSVFDREGSSDLHLFVPFDTEVPLLDGLSPLDSSFMAFNYSHSETLKSPEQNFQEKNGDKFTQASQALKESIRDASPVSLTENVIVSSTGLNLTYSPNSDCKWKLPNLEYHQQHSESKTCCIMPADELLIDEQAWGFLSTYASADTSNHTRNYLAMPSSEDRVYEVENLEFEYQISSKGYFDPTNDSYYMGGSGVWSGFPLFGVGSDLT